VVGNKEVADKLKVFAASGKVDMYNTDGSPFVELKAAPAGVTAQTVIDNYINAVGGKAKLNSLKSFEQKAKMMMGPMGIEMNLKVKDRSKMNMSMNMNGMELMKQVYDGEKGSMSQMGQSQPMGPDEIKSVKDQIRLFSELYYAEDKVQTTLKGMDMLNGEEVYVLEVKDAAGDVSTDYYNVKTGLKMKSVSASNVEGETVIEEVIIVDYKEFDGIKFPGTMKTSAQGQNIDIILESVTINPKLEDSLFKVN
jgi:outer membrane lipoprotein-sorting protein